jgi:hypothetical protein
MQSLHVGLEADIDQIPESGVEAVSVVGSAVVAVAFAGGSCDRWSVRTFVHVASQVRFAGTVAVVGKTAGPSEQAGHSAQKIRSVVVQSQEVGNSYCSAARAEPSFEGIVGTVAEAAGEQLAALWDGAGEATLVV